MFHIISLVATLFLSSTIYVHASQGGHCSDSDIEDIFGDFSTSCDSETEEGFVSVSRQSVTASSQSSLAISAKPSTPVPKCASPSADRRQTSSPTPPLPLDEVHAASSEKPASPAPTSPRVPTSSGTPASLATVTIAAQSPLKFPTPKRLLSGRPLHPEIEQMQQEMQGSSVPPSAHSPSRNTTQQKKLLKPKHMACLVRCFPCLFGDEKDSKEH